MMTTGGTLVTVFGASETLPLITFNYQNQHAMTPEFRFGS